MVVRQRVRIKATGLGCVLTPIRIVWVLSILRSSADCFIHADRSRRVWKKVFWVEVVSHTHAACFSKL